MKLLLTTLFAFNSMAFGFEVLPNAIDVTQINIGYHIHFSRWRFVALRDELIRHERRQGPDLDYRFKSSPEVLKKLAEEILKTSLFKEEQEPIREDASGVYRITLTCSDGRQVVRSVRHEDRMKYPDANTWIQTFGTKDPLAAAEQKTP